MWPGQPKDIYVHNGDKALERARKVTKPSRCIRLEASCRYQSKNSAVSQVTGRFFLFFLVFIRGIGKRNEGIMSIFFLNGG